MHLGLVADADDGGTGSRGAVRDTGAVARRVTRVADSAALLPRPADVADVVVSSWTLILDTASSALPRLATTGPRAVRQALARHPHTPRAILELLARDADPWVLWALSWRRRLPRSVATGILTNPAVYHDDHVAALACVGALTCPTLDPDIVARAAQHPTVWVRTSARRHPQYAAS